MPSFKYELTRRAYRAHRVIVQLSRVINPRQIRCKRHAVCPLNRRCNRRYTMPHIILTNTSVLLFFLILFFARILSAHHLLLTNETERAESWHSRETIRRGWLTRKREKKKFALLMSDPLMDWFRGDDELCPRIDANLSCESFSERYIHVTLSCTKLY